MSWNKPIGWDRASSRITGGAGAGVNGVEGATEVSEHSFARCARATEDSEGSFLGRKIPVEVFGGDFF